MNNLKFRYISYNRNSISKAVDLMSIVITQNKYTHTHTQRHTQEFCGACVLEHVIPNSYSQNANHKKR